MASAMRSLYLHSSKFFHGVYTATLIRQQSGFTRLTNTMTLILPKAGDRQASTTIMDTIPVFLSRTHCYSEA